MTLPTEAEVRASQAAFDAERASELLANPPEGYATARAEWEKWHDEPWTPNQWNRMSFGDQAYYARGGRRTPNEWMPDKDALDITARALALTPSPSIISGHRVWAYDLLDWLNRQGWKVTRG